MFLAIVNCRLIALEGGLVNPLQAFLFIDRYASAGHQEPACGKLSLGIVYVNSMMALTSLPIDRETMMSSAIL